VDFGEVMKKGWTPGCFCKPLGGSERESRAFIGSQGEIAGPNRGYN